ncbi:hypothetical protein EHQ43_10300 [Leptospira bouyouniensis]|uniref:Uncharacterized protein n=1 Tax=Leptospira bouyouniensis TaxID=2484911 RepID=A0A7I0HRR3_9LEPT|nr:hypothetical protein [Leptospira bouyouniensis]TGL05022.1 hypothetical protein EHQ43_10300 [Leptospira bouyouniensis]
MTKTIEEINLIMGDDSDILSGIRAASKEEENHAELYNPYIVLEENKLSDKLFEDFLSEKNPLEDLIIGSKG